MYARDDDPQRLEGLIEEMVQPVEVPDDLPAERRMFHRLRNEMHKIAAVSTANRKLVGIELNSLRGLVFLFFMLNMGFHIFNTALNCYRIFQLDATVARQQATIDKYESTYGALNSANNSPYPNNEAETEHHE